MKKTFVYIVPLLTGGICLFLRLMQVQFGFEADTGLPKTDFYHIFTPLAMALSAVCYAVMGRKERKKGQFPEDATLDATFSPPEIVLPMMIAGSFLMLGGSGLLLYAGALVTDLVSILMGILGLGSGLSLLLGFFTWRQGRISGNFLLPPILLYAIWLLITYKSYADYPVMEQFYAEVLAMAALTWATYHIAAFAFREGNRRLFTFLTPTAITITIASLGSGLPLPDLLLLGGGIFYLYSFWLSRKDT